MSNYPKKIILLQFVLFIIAISCNSSLEETQDSCPDPETLIFPENIEIKSMSQIPENIEIGSFQIFDGEAGFALGMYSNFPADYILFKLNKIDDNWEFSEIGESLPLNNIYFISRDTGFVSIGQLHDFDLARTFDGGGTWDSIRINTTQDRILHIHFDSDHNIYALNHNPDTGYSKIIKSVDLGNSWSDIYLPTITSQIKNQAAFEMAGDKLLFGEKDNTISVIDFDGNLEKSIPTNGELINSIYANSINHIYINQFSKTSLSLDEGENWEMIGGNPFKAVIINEKIIWSDTFINFNACPFEYEISYSNDNGDNWTSSFVRLENGLGFSSKQNLVSDEQIVIHGNYFYLIELN